jgi:hypothetical protein
MAPRQRSPTPDDDDRSPSPLIRNKKMLEKEEPTASSSSLTSESEIARDKHDIFNLFALLPVVLLTVVNYDWQKVVNELSPESAWTGDYFFAYWSATMLYFIVDLIWVAVVPICVKSPNVIIKHHFIALIYLIGPYLWPHYRWFMGACLTVELNTWFLIARRVAYKRNLSGTTLSNVIDACFYASWIIIRCIIYPAILYTFISMAIVGIAETQTIMHWELLFLPIHFFLCVLNLKWTYDLFQPIITRWYKGEQRPTRMSSGL